MVSLLFSGRPEVNPYELLTAMEGIEHRTTKIRSPRTKGFVERRNQTLLDECFRVSGSTTWFERVQSRQGYHLQGRTSAMALRDARGIEMNGRRSPCPLWRKKRFRTKLCDRYHRGPGVGELSCLYNGKIIL
jgi:hypothetical protein